MNKKDIENVIKQHAQQKRLSFRQLSLNAGKSPSYLSVFFHKDNQERLPEDVRISIAKDLDIPESMLGAPKPAQNPENIQFIEYRSIAIYRSVLLYSRLSNQKYSTHALQETTRMILNKRPNVLQRIKDNLAEKYNKFLHQDDIKYKDMESTYKERILLLTLDDIEKFSAELDILELEIMQGSPDLRQRLLDAIDHKKNNLPIPEEFSMFDHALFYLNLARVSLDFYQTKKIF